MFPGLCAQIADDDPQIRFGQCQNLARPQHQSGVHDVLGRGPPMDILRMFRRVHFGPKGGDQSRHADTIFTGGPGKGTGVDLDFQGGPVDGGGTELRDHAQSALHLGKCPFDQQHRPNGGRVREQASGLSGIKKMRVKRAVKY